MPGDYGINPAYSMKAVEHIVISDMHFSVRSSQASVDGFCAFLDALARESGPGAKVSLIIAGDFFNLDLLEPDGRADAAAPHPVTTLRRILERFPSIPRSLATFLSRGNEVRLLGGNHDIELFHPDVQEAFRDAVVAHRPQAAGEGLDGIDLSSPDALRIGGTVHVEHGNRFDGDNIFEPESFRRVLCGREPVFPLGSCMERRLLSTIPQLNYDGFSAATPWPLLTTILRRHGLTGGLNIITRYFVTAFGLMSESFRRRTGRRRREGEGAEATLDSPAKTFARLYLDRSLAFIFLLLWLAAAPLLLLHAAAVWLTVLGLLGVFFLASFLEGNRYGHAAAMTCREGARAILRSDGVTTVILGHTHSPEKTRFDGGAVYLNTGSFAVPARDGLPYVRVRHASGETRAELEFFRCGGGPGGRPA